MEQIRQRIDDRNIGVFGQFFHTVMPVGTNHNAVQIAGQYTCRILNGFAASQLQVAVREEQRLPAELVHTNFKGNSGSRGRLFKNHAQGLAL